MTEDPNLPSGQDSPQPQKPKLKLKAKGNQKGGKKPTLKLGGKQGGKKLSLKPKSDSEAGDLPPAGLTQPPMPSADKPTLPEDVPALVYRPHLWEERLRMLVRLLDYHLRRKQVQNCHRCLSPVCHRFLKPVGKKLLHL